MELRAADVLDLAAGLPLALDVEPYRERLAPLAAAVLEGAARQTIDRRRDLVLPDVWDGRLEAEVLAAIEGLRAELRRKLSILDEATRDLEHPRRSAVARAVVDRVLGELSNANDENLAALEELERALVETAEEERVSRASMAARGAFVAARIPVTEVRAAIARTARHATPGYGEDAAERSARYLARMLADEERRRAVRAWIETLAEGSAEHVPILAGALRELVARSRGTPPEEDLLWVQACVGLSFEFTLGAS